MRRSFIGLVASFVFVACSPAVGDDPDFDLASQGTAACNVTYTASESWPGGFKAEVKVVNGGGDKSGWTLTWTFPAGQRIQSLWNGEATQTDALVRVKAAAWNARLPRGGSASIGFVASGDSKAVPTDFALDGVRCGGAGPVTPTDPPAPPPGPSALELRWSYAGPIAGMHCTRFHEPADPDTWADNYLCANRDVGLTFSAAGPVAGRHCVQIREPSDPHSWNDNYLCAPKDLGLRWSYAGPIAGTRCTKIVEPSDPHTWNDNFLCQSTTDAPAPTEPPAEPPTGDPPKDPPPTDPPKPTGSPVARHGKLRVCGTRLCDQSGAVVQLRGVSTHGLQWYGWNKRCLGPAALDSLASEWKADLVRIALYVQEGGYETDPAGYRAQVDTLVDEIGKRGMYALIDWHILSPGDPMYNLARAKEFLRYVGEKHGGKPHVLFEIANEPNGVGWSTIRDYAEQVLSVIRDEKKLDTVTIVGTPDWSSLGVSGGRSAADVAAAPPRNASGTAYGNVMYTFHFYAASHKEAYRDVVRTYADKLPIFVTEWGTPTYSGDGFVDEASTAAWIALMAEKRLSWAYWNLSDNGQTGAILKPGACDAGKSTFTGAALQRSGQIVFAELTK